VITVETNIDKLISSLKGDLSSLQKGGEHYNGILRQVATSTLGVMKMRIHEEGKASSGGDIGQYSTKPAYISINEPVRVSLRPIGKTKQSTFKTGKKAGQDHKTRYFVNGYKEYKTAAGRNLLGKVNLSLSGQLNSQFTVIPTNEGWGLGWADKEKLERAKGFEKKYSKPIYNLSQEELENIGKSVNDYLDAIFEGTD
jgi:hypothetical protein